MMFNETDPCPFYVLIYLYSECKDILLGLFATLYLFITTNTDILSWFNLLN